MTRVVIVPASGLMCLIVRGWTIEKCGHAICQPHQRWAYKGKPANGVR